MESVCGLQSGQVSREIAISGYKSGLYVSEVMDGNLGVPCMLRGTFLEAFSQSRRLSRTWQNLRQSNQLAGAKIQCTLQTSTAALVFLPGSTSTEIIPPDLYRGLLRLG